MRKITLLKSGNRIVVSPTTTRIYDLLRPKLTMTVKEFLQGFEAKIARANDEPLVRLTDYECFGTDHKDRLATSFGFWRRVTRLLKKKGYKVVMRDLTPHPRPEVFEPMWDRLELFGIEFRPRQLELLKKVLANRCGTFDCYTGFGKTFLIGVLALLLPKARIDVVSKRRAVLRNRIYPELCGMLPDVGIVGFGKKRKGHRVMCYSAGSLGHAPGDADFLFGDEVHELVTDEVARNLGRYDMSRNFGFSATQNMRLDGKDMRCEAIFGHELMKVTYQEGQEHGNVVPIQVHWRSVITDYNPCEDYFGVEKKRHGLWTHDFRNDLIAEDARQYDKNTQVLIVVDTVEHAMHLKKRLPEFTLAYRQDGLDPDDRKWYVKHNFIGESEPYMDLARRDKLTNAFEEGKLKKAICTTIWNVGFSPNQLAVLIRADGGGSPINDTQIPGRTCRANEGKEFSIVHDYMDQFDEGFKRKAGGRRKSYESLGWEQVYPDRPEPGSLREQLYWDFDD